MDRYTGAIMELEDFKFTEGFYAFETVDTAIEALEKQIAKSIVVRPRDGYIVPDYLCPTCGEIVLRSYFRQRDGGYCEKCGQRLTF